MGISKLKRAEIADHGYKSAAITDVDPAVRQSSSCKDVSTDLEVMMFETCTCAELECNTANRDTNGKKDDCLNCAITCASVAHKVSVTENRKERAKDASKRCVEKI